MVVVAPIGGNTNDHFVRIRFSKESKKDLPVIHSAYLLRNDRKRKIDPAKMSDYHYLVALDALSGYEIDSLIYDMDIPHPHIPFNKGYIRRIDENGVVISTSGELRKIIC